MRRDFHEPWEPEDVFSRQEASDRRARIEAARAEHEAFEKHEAEQAAVRKENARLFTLGANERIRLCEYDAYGVEPPVINGVPTRSSLPLLLSIGWTIEETSEGRALVPPPVISQHKRKRRQDYESST